MAAALLLAWGVRLATKQEFGIARFNLASKLAILLPALALLPPVARLVARWVGVARRVPRRRHLVVALAVGALGTAYLAATTLATGGRFAPVVKDEYSYLLQARMLASGRLWLPRHEVSDFFETTAVLTDPVYASAYPPGNAMLYAPGVWLGLPHWVTSALITAAALAALCRVVSALIDVWAGVAASLLLLSVPLFFATWRFAMAQVPILLFGLLLVGALLRWRASRFRLRWAVVMGAAGGWALLIRPQDAAIYLLPVAVAMLLAARRRPRAALLSILASVAAASPFLALQVVTNLGVTGRWYDYPHQLYHRRDLPTFGYGMTPDMSGDVRPKSVSPQKQSEFDAERADIRRRDLRNRGDWRNFWNARLPAAMAGTLPSPVVTVVLPVGLLALRRRSRWVLASTVPLFLLAYLPWPFILPHYATAVAPGALFLVVLAMRSMEARAGRFRPTLAAAFALAVVGVAVAGSPLVDRARAPRQPDALPQAELDRQVRNFTNGRAVVLLKYGGSFAYRMRPFNIDVANPDDAPIVRALDLGSRNAEIAGYYARTQPDRKFFRYDFADQSITPLGTAGEYLAALQQAGPTTRSSP